MKRFSVIAVSLLFVAFLAVSATAQTAPGGVGLIDWGVLEDPTKGIKKYVAALNALDLEFKPANDELKAMATKYEAQAKEIQNFKDLIEQRKPIPISDAEVQKKIDALGQLERDIKKKQEDAKAAYGSRANVVLGPIQDDILKALGDFAVARGFSMILDGAQLQRSGMLLAFNPKSNVTEEFITFYNARPATPPAK